jgi:AraC family transcriptional regulator
MQISEPQILETQAIELVGIAQDMNLMSMPIAELWKRFRSHEAVRTKSIPNFYSVQHYHAPVDLQNFSPAAIFTKWAAAPKEFFDDLPEECVSLFIPEGLYAQFEVIAPPTAAKEVFGFIYGEWLPKSGYQLDHRHQLEVLPHDYSTKGDQAREVIWIPITYK